MVPDHHICSATGYAGCHRSCAAPSLLYPACATDLYGSHRVITALIFDIVFWWLSHCQTDLSQPVINGLLSRSLPPAM